MPSDKLNPQQEAFCELYVDGNKEFFGNGVQSYIEVYQPDQTKKGWYNVACSRASQLLSNVKVYTKINEMLEANGLNDQFVDKQLLFLITQHADFGNKLGAMKEYNKLKQRIVDRKDITTKGDKITTFTVATKEAKESLEQLYAGSNSTNDEGVSR